MKLSCEKYLLQNAISIAMRATANKSPIPALEGILIEAGQNIKITGFDLKKGVYTFIEANVEEPGSIVLNSKLFGEIIRRLPDGIVEISTDLRGMTNIKCGKSEFSIMGIDSNEYPELPEVDNEKHIELPQNILKKMINETLFAVSDNDSRPVYMGTLFELENSTLTLVSVDGYRLALRRENVEEANFDKYDFIVPGSALSDIEKICNENDNVLIDVGTKHISFKIGETTIIARRLEGDFLNYKKAIPENFKNNIVVEKTEMLKAVDRVALLIDEKTKNPIRLIFGDGTINFSCTTPLGKAEDICLCEGSIENLEIGFNDKYLMEALKNAPADKLKVSLNTGSSPCILSSPENDNFVYMILPVRLRAGE